MTRFLRLAALAALLLPLAASAQPGDRPDRGEHHLQALTERLDLTDAQVALVRETMTEAREADRARTQGRRAASWALASRLAPTMSDAQLDALRTQMEERAERRRERAGETRERRAEHGDSARDEALGLTDAQKAAIQALRAEQRDVRGDRRAEMAEILTDEQEAILLVHRALSPPRGMRGRGGARGARPGRRGR